MFERAEKEFVIPSSAISLEDIAQATQNIYLNRGPRSYRSRHNLRQRLNLGPSLLPLR